MQINISRNKILINVVPKLHANKKKSRLDRCNHCGGTLKNEFDMTVCIMCSPSQIMLAATVLTTRSINIATKDY